MQHLHCVYIFAPAPSRLGFCHYLHNDRDKRYCVHDHKVDNSASFAYWSHLGHHLYHDRDEWNRFDHYELYHSSRSASRIRLDYHLHNNPAKRYRLNCNEPDNDPTLGANHHIHNHWYKRDCLNCDKFDDGPIFSTTTTAVDIGDHIRDDQYSWVDNHNIPKHSGHSPSLFECSSASTPDNVSYNVCDHQYSWLDNHNIPKHRDHSPSLFECSSTSTPENVSNNVCDHQYSWLDNHNLPKYRDHSPSLFQRSTAPANQGSVIVASSTSTAAGPYYSQACGGKYSDNFGQLWCLQCQTAYFFNDLTSIVVGSFEECLEACDTYVPSPDRARGASCIAITWGPRTVGGECYRKFDVTDSRLDRRQDSAYKCDQAAVPPSASSIINTNTANIASTGKSSGIINTNTANIASTRASTPASSAPIGASSVPVSSNPIVPTTRPTTPATSNPVVPPTSNAISPVTSNPNVPTTRATTPVTSNANSPVSSSPNVPITTPATSNPGVPATLIGTATTATSVNLELAFQPCPSSNGQQFINQLGNVYDIACGCDYQFSDLSGSTHQDYFQDCILACDRYVPDPNRARGAPCIGVSWGSPAGNPGGNCFLKYRIEQIRCGEPRFCAAVKHDYVFTSFISTSRVTATASVVPVPASSSNAGNGFTATPIATSSPPAVFVPSSSTSRPAVIASSSTSQPAVVVPSSSTSPPAIVVPSSSTSRAPVVSSSNPPAVLPPSSTINTFTPVNTFAPPQISRTVSCPAQNGSIYTDTWGQAWEVRCGMNIRGTNAKAAHADSWEKCLQFCDILGGVVGVTYPGGGGDNPNPLSQNCYPYQAFTEFVSGAVPTLCAARPLNISTGNFFNTESLCPMYDTETFTDAYSRTYQIRCDHSVGGTALSPTITKTLEGCLSYCSTYNSCVGVQFTAYVERDRVDNCFPKSSAGALSYSVGTSCAQLLT
ncbi:MAG: hypothetical protein Q9221_001535 [Calogaya cf. arnoldii]